MLQYKLNTEHVCCGGDTLSCNREVPSSNLCRNTDCCDSFSLCEFPRYLHKHDRFFPHLSNLSIIDHIYSSTHLYRLFGFLVILNEQVSEVIF
jgi:hypothetical protein